MTRVFTLVVVGAAAFASASLALAQSKHSGSVSAVGVDGQTITIDELGASSSGAPAEAPRTVAVTPDTKVQLVTRAAPASPGGQDDWLGGLKETPVSAADIRPGDFVTVRMEQRDGRVVATDVSVVRPETGASASP